MEGINIFFKYIYSQKKIKKEGLFLKTLCLESISEFKKFTLPITKVLKMIKMKFLKHLFLILEN